MPSKIEDLPSSSEKRDGFEFRRTLRHHQPSRFAREKPGLKFKDKGVRIENQTRPPYADQSLEFVKNAENGYVVRAKYPGMKSSSSSSEDELIKYMSKVPKFLQKGEMTQDNALNFGVLDWGRLEQWSHKQTSSSVHSTVDYSPILKPMKGKMVNPSEIVTSKSPKNKKEVNSGKVKPSSREGVDSKSTKGKEKCFDEDNTYIEEIPSSKPAKESVVLILPRDFSKPCSSSEVSPKPPRLGKSGQHNWGSFSDLFSVDEIQTDDTFSGAIQRNHVLDTENDLDLKLDTLIKAQDETKTVHLPDKKTDMNTKSSNGSDQSEPMCSVQKTGESLKHHRRGFSLCRMTKSFSLKEGSASWETSSSSKSQIPAKTRSGPLKMLLGPLFKPKVVNQIKENSNDLTMDPPIPVMVPEVENNEASTIKAFLHLTVKSGLPLFKFVVETKNEILASTMSFGEVDISLMYTFYSVHKIRKKNNGWKNHKVNNNKPCGFGYNVVGQMKVSKPKETEEIRKVKESVLYTVDVSKADGVTSELSTGRELAAVVVNMPVELGFKDEELGQTMVILPRGDHSVPHEGVPSSLINRWTTGGLCDCGGWDEGCKLRILGDMKDHKGLICSRSRSMNFRCDLYDQEESKQCKPFFRVVPFRDGLFSVEFDTKMSSLQAFSICVAVINSKQPVELGAIKIPSILNEGRERHTRTHSHPPVSPAGRV